MNLQTYRNDCRWAVRVVAAIAIAVALAGLSGCDTTHRLLDEQLIYHVKRGDARGAYLCILAGADVNARDSAGSSAMHLASAEGFDKIVELLIARKGES